MLKFKKKYFQKPKSKSIFSSEIGPTFPTTIAVFFSLSSWTSIYEQKCMSWKFSLRIKIFISVGTTFIFLRPASIYLISALSNKFSTTVVPSARAARRRALFERDLLPGSVIYIAISIIVK